MATIRLSTEKPMDQSCELLLALPFDTLEQRFKGFEVEEAAIVGVVTAQGRGQRALRLAARAGARPQVRFEVEEAPGDFPEWIFAGDRGRHETPSDDLVALMAETAPQRLAPAERVTQIVRHVESRFAYGVRDVGLGDDSDEMGALWCDTHLGTCVDTHSYAVAAMRAAGVEAAYVSGVFFKEGTVQSQPGHCWFVVRAEDAPHHWDISHHLKYDLGPVRPLFNPKPGFRFALAAGRDLVFEGAEGPVTFGRLSGFHILAAGAAKLSTVAQVSNR